MGQFPIFESALSGLCPLLYGYVCGKHIKQKATPIAGKKMSANEPRPKASAPRANWGKSKTPIGPFQMIVPTCFDEAGIASDHVVTDVEDHIVFGELMHRLDFGFGPGGKGFGDATTSAGSRIGRTRDDDVLTQLHGHSVTYLPYSHRPSAGSQDLHPANLSRTGG